MIRDLIHQGGSKGRELGKHAKSSLSDLYLGMNDLFGSLFKSYGIHDLAAKEFFPKSEISETEKSIDLKIELPGMEEKDIHVKLENNLLIISGEKRQEEEIKKKNYHVSELSYGKFERAFSLPNYADYGKINAKFKNGALNVSIAKTKTAPKKAKKIEISKS